MLMGAPVSTRPERWAMARAAVAGRLVNAYSRRDWVLGLIYRGSNGFIKGAGALKTASFPLGPSLENPGRLVDHTSRMPHADQPRAFKSALPLFLAGALRSAWG